MRSHPAQLPTSAASPPMSQHGGAIAHSHMMQLHKCGQWTKAGESDSVVASMFGGVPLDVLQTSIFCSKTQDLAQTCPPLCYAHASLSPAPRRSPPPPRDSGWGGRVSKRSHAKRQSCGSSRPLRQLEHQLRPRGGALAHAACMQTTTSEACGAGGGAGWSKAPPCRTASIAASNWPYTACNIHSLGCHCLRSCTIQQMEVVVQVASVKRQAALHFDAPS